LRIREPTRVSQLPEIENQYNVKSGGLLEFATVQMVDFRDDLMLSTIMNFCSDYIGNEPYKNGARSTVALEDLKKYGLHAKCIYNYLYPVSMPWYESDAAQYISTYSFKYPDDLLSEREDGTNILDRLSSNLGAVSYGHWLSGNVPRYDLKLLAHLPQTMLLPQNGVTPLLMIPPNTASTDAYAALAMVFQGSLSLTASEVEDSKSSAARTLYFLYLEQYPDFWTYVIKAADTVVIKDFALGAIALVGKVINATWTPLPAETTANRFPLPNEKWLCDQCNDGDPLPQTGIEAIISQRTASVVLPYLMKPAQTFSNSVGGGRGDVESTAWKVAVAKHDALKQFHAKIKQSVGITADGEDLVTAVAQRLAQGPMGESQAGGRVGTMEK